MRSRVNTVSTGIFSCSLMWSSRNLPHTSSYTNLVCVVQRRVVVSGAVEPTDDECEWHSEGEEEELSVSICLLHLSEICMLR